MAAEPRRCGGSGALAAGVLGGAKLDDDEAAEPPKPVPTRPRLGRGAPSTRRAFTPGRPLERTGDLDRRRRDLKRKSKVQGGRVRNKG